ncbi:hypothetical protein ACOJTA_05670 [Malaciobacter sp. WC5094]
MTIRNFLTENELQLTAEQLIDKRLKSVLVLIDHIENTKGYKKRDREIYQTLKLYIEDLFKKQTYEY